MMLTTDLSLRVDPIYGPIAKRFHENPDQLADAFAKAWFKLLHRDIGPRSRYLGPWVPEPQLWQDPVPPVDHELVGEQDIAALKRTLLDSGCPSLSWSPLPGKPQPASGVPISVAVPTERGSALLRKRIGSPTSHPGWPRC